MAKVKFTSALNEFSLEMGFLGSGMFSVNAKGTKATYNDFGGGAIELQGKNFQTDFIGFGLTGGSIKEAKFLLGDETLVKVEGSFNVKQFNNAIATGELEGILSKLLAGKDSITGSNDDDSYIHGFGGKDTLKGLGGDDILNGGKGNDSLNGGDGNDTIEFGTGFGKDTVQGFDAEGGAGAQDLIHILNGATYEIQEDADGNALIWLSDTDTLTLVGIDPDQIDGTDFLMM
jgi:Ca2+-binding RTX toxin-like protein